MATDISDKSWDDLYEADYGTILRELASEIDTLDGNASREEICVGLMQYHDREDEVPEEYAEYLENDDDTATDSQADTESDDGDDTEAAETGDSDDVRKGETHMVEDGEPDAEGDGDEETDDEEEDGEFQTANEYEPSHDEQFIIEASVLQEWLDHIRALVDEAKLHLTRDGWEVRAVDPSNVAMVETSLDERAFESYDVPEEGVIGINVVRVADIVGGAQADDLVNVGYDATTRNLVFTYGGHEFTKTLIDPDAIRSEPDLPDLDLPVDLTIEASAVKTGVGYADSLADHVAVATTGGVFSIRAEGDTDSYEGEFEDVDVHLYPGETKRSLFSTDFLTDVLKPIDGERDLRIRHGQEFPIWLDAAVGDDGHVHYMIAPRIQSG